MFIWFKIRFLTAKKRPEFQRNVDAYGRRSHLYFLQLWIWLLFSISKKWLLRKITGVTKETICVFFIMFESIYRRSVHLRENSRIPSHTIYVPYLGYSLLLNACGNCRLTLKTLGFWNLLESSPSRIPSIKCSQKIDSNPIYYFIFQTWEMDFRHSKIDLNTTRMLWYSNCITYKPSTKIELLWNPDNIKTTYSEYIPHLVPSQDTAIPFPQHSCTESQNPW